MSIISIDQCEQRIGQTLEDWRAEYRRALDIGGQSNSFVVFNDIEMCVDQVRCIVVGSPGSPDAWSVRNGKYHISTTTITDRAFLSTYVGRNRYFSVELLFLIFCDIISDIPVRSDDRSMARLINLLVVEPYTIPSRGLPIWLTAATNIAAGRVLDNLYSLPQMSTDFDILYEELPLAGPYVDVLRPEHAKMPAESLPHYEMHLLKDVHPELATTIDSLDTDEQRAHLFSSFEEDLRAYVRKHLFRKIAEAVNAAERDYVSPRYLR